MAILSVGKFALSERRRVATCSKYDAREASISNT